MVTNKASARRYLAAYLPLLSAERIVRAGVAPPDTPFALVEKVRGAMRIAALSHAALDLGLSPGMALADARAREPDLAACPHDAAADAALLGWLADGCERYTPMVATQGEAGLVLDLTGCEAVFAERGSAKTGPCFDRLSTNGQQGRSESFEAQLARDLVARLAGAGFTARLARGDTPDMAHALARFACRDPRALPVEALALDGDGHIALHRAGLSTIGDLADRPRAPLAARFGPQLPVLLARLLGEEDPRITPRRHAPEIEVERRYAEPMMTTGPLLAVIADMAHEAARALDLAGTGGRRFGVALFRVDGHVARLTVETGAATRDPAVIARLFDERLDSLADPLDPGFGYDMLRFAVLDAEPLDPDQQPLEGGEARIPDLAPLLDRLAVRFGAASVRRFHPRDHHFPEHAATTRPARAGAAALPWPAPEPGEPPLRPLTLFDPPQPITVLAEVPDGPPRRFQWRGEQHRVRLSEGPERIAYPWWRVEQGEGPTRDYYRVEDESGRRFWLFRHGLYEERGNPDWYIHGLFA
nr:DNA polymerase Y family protein [Stakelama pacifica]